jgi:hypothetical protein
MPTGPEGERRAANANRQPIRIARRCRQGAATGAVDASGSGDRAMRCKLESRASTERVPCSF